MTIRRAVDVAVSLLAALVVLPLALMVAVLIAVRLGTPLIFRQTRSGLGGRTFTIYKFRSMHDELYPRQPDAERTPPLGRRLRTYSLDELPQLWNVLRGDMSLIGPRPTIPEQVRHYSDHQRRRLEVRPGLTGYAQVTGRNRLSWPERIELDIWYIDNRSLRLDLWIVWATLRNLVRPDGVEGEDGVNPDFPPREDPSLVPENAR